MTRLGEMREDYTAGQLREADLAAGPFVQFEQWFNTAREKGLHEPNAMTVASVNAAGQPSARIVLLKDFSEDGFVFYTNYDSRKGREILETRKVALVFFWSELERQVRIEGHAEKVSAHISDAYFASRPRASQLGAHVSPQSQVIPDRDFLNHRQQELESRFKDQPIPRPEHWGGINVIPEVFEFWQGRSGRLHDRIRYTKNNVHQQNNDRSWLHERLAP